MYFAGNLGKNISKNLTSKNSQKPLGHTKQSSTNSIKNASKTAEVAGDLIKNIISDETTTGLKNFTAE